MDEDSKETRKWRAIAKRWTSHRRRRLRMATVVREGAIRRLVCPKWVWNSQTALTDTALASIRAEDEMEVTMFKTARCAPRSLDLSVDTKEPVKATWDTQDGVGPWPVGVGVGSGGRTRTGTGRERPA
jgi:hypothetical protein